MEHVKDAPLGLDSTLLTNIRLGQKEACRGTYSLAYFVPIISDEEKRFLTLTHMIIDLSAVVFSTRPIMYFLTALAK